MDLRGGGQEKRLGMPSSLGPYNNNNNPSSSSSIGEPAIPSKISPTITTTTITSVISTRRDLSSSTHNTGNGISVLDHHHHYQQQQQIRQDSPDSPPPQPPAQTQDPDRDPDPVSIAVVSAAIASISAPGSNPRTPKPIKNLSPTSIRYRECLKNHAASIGGHVVDGCGEFMPGGEEGTPEALKCAACDCHRNFHLKEVDGEPQHGANCFYCYNPNNKIDGSRTRRLPLPPPPQPLAPPLQQHHHHHQKFSLGLPTSPPSGPIPPMMMAFGGGGAATDSSSEELNVFHSNAGGGTPVAPPQFSLSSKKRFRTKFTQEQKDKMLEFAEKVGWRIQKQDELAVQQFCAEVGVKRQVLKVWMHNNKHAMKKKDV